jgi:hypothetical protein
MRVIMFVDLRSLIESKGTDNEDCFTGSAHAVFFIVLLEAV